MRVKYAKIKHLLRNFPTITSLHIDCRQTKAFTLGQKVVYPMYMYCRLFMDKLKIHQAVITSAFGSILCFRYKVGFTIDNHKIITPFNTSSTFP